MNPQAKYPKLKTLFNEIEKIQKEILIIGKKILEMFNKEIYLLHFLLLSSLNRTLNITDGILEATNKWNFIVSAALLRMQIETLASLVYVSKSHIGKQSEFYFKEGRLKKMEVVGNQVRWVNIRERELINFANMFFPWMTKVYEETCRIVHFSNKNIYSMTRSFNNETRNFEWAIAVGNENWSEGDIKELLEVLINTEKEILNYSKLIAEDFKKSLSQK